MLFKVFSGSKDGPCTLWKIWMWNLEEAFFSSVNRHTFTKTISTSQLIAMWHCMMIPSWRGIRHMWQTLRLDAGWAVAQRQWGVTQSLGIAVGFLCSAGSESACRESEGWVSGRSKKPPPLNHCEFDSAGHAHCAWNTMTDAFSD